MTDTSALVRTRAEWSFQLALVIAVAPIGGAIAAAWIELSQPGESAMWIVAGAFFLVCPVVGAVATESTAARWGLRVAIAFALFAVLWAIWIANVPVRTQPGVWFTGGSRLSGAVMASLAAIAWLFATSVAGWILKRSPRLALLFGGVVFFVLSAIAFVVGEMTP